MCSACRGRLGNTRPVHRFHSGAYIHFLGYTTQSRTIRDRVGKQRCHLNILVYGRQNNAGEHTSYISEPVSLLLASWPCPSAKLDYLIWGHIYLMNRSTLSKTLGAWLGLTRIQDSTTVSFLRWHHINADQYWSMVFTFIFLLAQQHHSHPIR